MRIITIVQSRFGSSRLPGKAVKLIAGRPMLGHVLERAKMIRGVDRVVLATTVNDRDTPLVELATAMGVDVHRGDEHDVLSRFKTIVDAYAPNVVMRITGDCPLLDPRLAEHVLNEYLADPSVAITYSATYPNGTFPDGLDVEVMSAVAVLAADRRARYANDREHVTRWMRRHLPARALQYVAGRVNVEGQAVNAEPDITRVKLSVDTEEDLARVRAVYAELAYGDVTLDATAAAYRKAIAEGILA